jgi:hypothetical protein
LHVPVAVARWASTVGAALAALGLSLITAGIILGWGQDEVARVRARYGAMLVEVAEVDESTPATRVRVVSLAELVRLAERAGACIFYHKREPGGYRYFVPDGSRVYEYVLETRPKTPASGGHRIERGPMLKHV